MLGVGQDKDWFNSQFVVALLIVTLVGLAAFVIWETTDRKPIVDLSVFANRGFSVSMVVIAMAFGAMFGSIVLVPLWLQTSMGYTATWAGYNSAFSGVTMIIAAPLTTVLMARFDPRAVACVGLLIGAARVVDAGRLRRPDDLLAVDVAATRVRRRHGHERHPADGHVDQLAGRKRTSPPAPACSTSPARWRAPSPPPRSSRCGTIRSGPAARRWPANCSRARFLDAATAAGMSHDKAVNLLDLMVQGQSVMLATNRTFLIVGVLQLATAAIVWIAPKPPKRAGGGMPLAH